MKRTLLSLAIPAFLISNAAMADIEIWNKDNNQLNMYGQVNAKNIISKQGNNNGDHSYGRLGFLGTTQITQSIQGYGHAAFQKSAGNGDSETRYAYAGLDFGSYGQIDYGRNDGVTKMVQSYTDVLPEFGGDAASMTLLSERETAVVTYRNNDFYGAIPGLNFAVQYADKSSASDTVGSGDVGTDGYNRANRQAFGISGEYALLDSGVTLGATYSATSKATIEGIETDNDESRGQSWILGMQYDKDNVYFAAIYNRAKNILAYLQEPTSDTAFFASKVKGYELVASYSLDLDVGRSTPSIAYIQHKVKPVSSDEYTNFAKYVNLGLEYDFNANMSANIDYKINLLRESDGVENTYTKNSLAIGLVYQF